MKRYTLKKCKKEKTVPQLIQSLQTDNKDVDAILQAARLQRIERQERSYATLKILCLVALTLLLVTIIVCSFFADKLILGVSAAVFILYIAIISSISI